MIQRRLLALANSRTWHTRRAFSALPLTEHQFNKRSEEYLESLLDCLDLIGDEIEVKGWDVLYSSGVLTLKLGANGTYVINKQPPNKQIWLSSPISGPSRFEWNGSSWVGSRDASVELKDLLDWELERILKIKVNTPER